MSTRQRRARAPSFLTAFLLIAMTDLALRTLGFARSIALARRLAGNREAIPGASAVARDVIQRVEMASVFYPGRARCLEQSLALYVLLRRRAIAAELRLGVQPYPFNAHAWVELYGAPLNERPETISQFVPIEDFAV
jgi:transglutaminase-like putative cysteine protease